MQTFKMTFIAILFLLNTASFPQESPTLSWFENLEEAQKAVQENDKSILLYFSGSDWCRPCILLKRDVLTNKTFEESAANDFVVLQIDFPSRKKNQLSKEQTTYNESLAEKYNSDGHFPLVVVLDKNLKKLGNVKGYQQEGVEAYLQKIRLLISDAG